MGARRGSETLIPLPTTEEKLLQPASIYAVNKRDHEEMFLSVGRALGIPTVALRLFNAYGSRQALSNPYTGVAAIFISRLLNDQPPLMFEDGEQRRDFVHVRTCQRLRGCPGERPAGLGRLQRRQRTADHGNEMARVLARLLHKNIAPEILKSTASATSVIASRTSPRSTRLGFRPRRAFEAGMDELIEWVTTAKAPVNRSVESLAELQRHKLVV